MLSEESNSTLHVCLLSDYTSQPFHDLLQLICYYFNHTLMQTENLNAHAGSVPFTNYFMSQNESLKLSTYIFSQTASTVFSSRETAKQLRTLPLSSVCWMASFKRCLTKYTSANFVSECSCAVSGRN